MLRDSFRTWQAAPLPCYVNNLDSLRTWQFTLQLCLRNVWFLRTWQAVPNLCCQNKFDFSIIVAGCSTAVLGNKVVLFRTWQAALQLCIGMGLIWLELGRCPHSNAPMISFIRLQFGSLLCSHVAGIRLELGRLLCGCAAGTCLICVKLSSLLCSGAGIRLVPLYIQSNPILISPIRDKPLFWPRTGKSSIYLELSGLLSICSAAVLLAWVGFV